MPKRARPPYAIEWDHSSWEQALWRPEDTFRRVLSLVDRLADEHGRRQIADQIVPTDHDFYVPFTVDADGQVAIGSVEKSGRRAAEVAHRIHRAMRALAREEAARIMTQVDTPDESGRVQRRISVRWDRQTKSVARQLKVFEKAVRSRSPYKIETAWFALTPRAHEYMSVGYESARRRGDLVDFRHEVEVPASIIPIPMLSRELLAVVLPYAVHAASRPGRRPVHPRDEAFAVVLGAFVEISGVSTGATRRGGINEPTGPGADFVHEIERIFGTRLMTAGSTHALRRARRRQVR